MYIISRYARIKTNSIKDIVIVIALLRKWYVGIEYTILIIPLEMFPRGHGG